MNTVQQHMNNIRNRFLRKRKQTAEPKEACSKCSNHSWYSDDACGGWYCFICGARGHYEGQKFVQY